MLGLRPSQLLDLLQLSKVGVVMHSIESLIT